MSTFLTRAAYRNISDFTFFANLPATERANYLLHDALENCFVLWWAITYIFPQITVMELFESQYLRLKVEMSEENLHTVITPPR